MCNNSYTFRLMYRVMWWSLHYSLLSYVIMMLDWLDKVFVSRILIVSPTWVCWKKEFAEVHNLWSIAILISKVRLHNFRFRFQKTVSKTRKVRKIYDNLPIDVNPAIIQRKTPNFKIDQQPSRSYLWPTKAPLSILGLTLSLSSQTPNAIEFGQTFSKRVFKVSSVL